MPLMPNLSIMNIQSDGMFRFAINCKFVSHAEKSFLAGLAGAMGDLQRQVKERDESPLASVQHPSASSPDFHRLPPVGVTELAHDRPVARDGNHVKGRAECNPARPPINFVHAELKNSSRKCNQRI